MQLKHERALRIVLRVVGTVSMSAVFAVAMPGDWMAAAHAWLGLGEMPREPIVGYLARSASALYALGGALAWRVSYDLERLLPVVRFMGISAIVLGAVLIVADTAEGLPLHWILGEGPIDIAIGALILSLSRCEDAEA